MKDFFALKTRGQFGSAQRGSIPSAFPIKFGKSVLLDSTLDELNTINIGHLSSGIYSLCINFEKLLLDLKS